MLTNPMPISHFPEPYMTTHNRNTITRFLAISSLLIFFLPFFQMCSDRNIKENGFIKAYSNAKTQKEKETAFEQSKNDFSLTGYELAMIFEPEFLSFTAIMVLNFTICICIFRRHTKLLFLSFLNLVFILFSFVMLVVTLPGFGQIRYGMYACIINAIIILFYFISFIRKMRQLQTVIVRNSWFIFYQYITQKEFTYIYN